MADDETAESVLAELRDTARLGHLQRRPRCSDGSLDMRSQANRGLSKHARVTDYYDPCAPSDIVEELVITELRRRQQMRYDSARFRELTERVARLERENTVLWVLLKALTRYREKAWALILS